MFDRGVKKKEVDSALEYKQYLAEVLADRDMHNPSALIDTFTEKFFSHGYPMDASFLKENGIDVSGLDDETESMVYKLLDSYRDAGRELAQASDPGHGAIIIQSDVGHTMIYGGAAKRSVYRGKKRQS